jgi:tetratricopeptide (TPR) repeat protein
MTQVYGQIVAALQAGRFEDAEQRASAWLSQHPHDAEALHLRAMAYSRLGRFDAGRADFEAIIDRHPQPHAVLNNLGNLEKRAGRIEAAVEAYRSALVKSPNFADAGFNLGTCLAELGDLDEAGRHFEAALKAQPQHLAALNGLGNIRVRQNRDDDALALFDAVLSVRSDAVLARINRGALRRQMGEAALSLEDLQLASQQAPNLGETHYQLANTLRTMGQGEAAAAAFERALGLQPERVDIHRDLASLLWEMGAGPAATARMEARLQSNPDADLYYAHAEILMRTGRGEAAEAAATAALALDPAHSAAQALRGELRRNAGEPAQAMADLRAAFKTSGEADCAIRHQLVEALLSAGEAAEALEHLEFEPAAEHLQKHVALKSVAWRCLGDDRYRRFYDYDAFTAKRFIEVPDGFDTIEAFNAALDASLERLHTTKAQPLDQTLFGGTQSPGRLWDEADPVIAALGQRLLEAAGRFVADLPDDPEHPFLRRKSAHLKLTGAWSVRLRSGGGHVDHVHPAGWISACYYVRVPDGVLAGERAGWLRLGASGVRGLDLPAERYVKPEPGAVIFFPSYMWHGVEAFTDPDVRVTAPFDLIPV